MNDQIVSTVAILSINAVQLNVVYTNSFTVPSVYISKPFCMLLSEHGFPLNDKASTSTHLCDHEIIARKIFNNKQKPSVNGKFQFIVKYIKNSTP